MGKLLAWFQAAFLLGSCCFGSNPSSPSNPKAKKINWINGHSFEKQCLNTHALCAYCRGRFRNPKNKRYSCKACCTVVHKGCRWAAAPCTENLHDSSTPILKEEQEIWNKCPPAEDAHCGEKAQVSNLSILEEAKQRSGKCPPEEDDRCTVNPQVSPTPVQEETVSYDKCPTEEDYHCIVNPQVSPTPVQEVTISYDKCPPEEDANKTTDECQGKVGEKEPCKIRKTDTLENVNAIKILGEGGFGQVILVNSKRDNKEYAMKVIKKKSVCDNMKKLWTEKKVLQIASTSPFLIGLHSCFQTPSWLCFITSYAHGGDLARHVNKHGAVPEDYIRFYTAEIALGLDFLHQKSIIHRDIKLENILLDHEGHAQITDFGLCKMLDGRDQKTRTMCGTPFCCAPEIIEEKEYGFAVDWWALGMALWIMASAKFPYPGVMIRSFQDMKAVMHRPLLKPQDISDDFYQLLHGFLTNDPEYRLGGDPQYGLSHIQQHPFFRGLDWEKVEKKQMRPPYQPPSAPALNQPYYQLIDPTSGQEIDQSLFADFDYVIPS